jgi:hypothetical protein
MCAMIEKLRTFAVSVEMSSLIRQCRTSASCQWRSIAHGQEAD